MQSVSLMFHQTIKKWYGQLALITLPILILSSPLLFNTTVIVDSDPLTYLYPIYDFYQKSIRVGENFLWNPWIYSGFPTFVSITGGFLSPINWLVFKFLPLFSSYYLLIVVNTIIGSFLTLRFTHRIGVSPTGSLIAAYAYMMYAQSSDLTVANALPLLPGLLLLLQYSFENPTRWRYAIFGSLLIGHAWLTVHFNWILISMTGAGIYALYVGWKRYQINGAIHDTVRIINNYALMCVIGVAIGLIQLIPTWILLQSSVRAAGISYRDAIIGSIAPFNYVRLALPYLNIPYLTNGGQFYLGALALFLFVISLATTGVIIKKIIKNRNDKDYHTPRREYDMIFFGLLFIFFIALSLEHSPLFIIWQKIPILNFLRIPGRWMFLGLFAASVHAGYGYDLILNQDKCIELITSKIFKIAKICMAILLVVSISATILTLTFKQYFLNILYQYFNASIYPHTSKLPLDHYHAVITNMFESLSAQFNVTHYQIALSFIFLLAAYGLIKKHDYLNTKKISFELLAVTLVLLNIIIISPRYYLTMPMDAFRETPATAAVIQDKGSVLALFPGLAEFQLLTTPHNPSPYEQFVFQQAMLLPNAIIHQNRKTVDGYDNLIPTRYARLLAMVGSERAVAGEKLTDLKLSIAEKLSLFIERKSLLDMLGVRYIISAYELPPNEFTLVDTMPITSYKVPLLIYENPHALPFVFIAKHITYLPLVNEDEQLASLIRPGINFHENTFITCHGCALQSSPATGTVEIIKKTNATLIVRASLEDQAWIVVNSNNIPGWSAAIDGADAPIFPANVVFQAVLVPAGTHTVSFSYHYPTLSRFSDFKLRNAIPAQSK